MYAQVVHGGTTLERREEMDRIVVDQLIPALQVEPGFAGAMNLVDRESGNAMMIMLWESEEQALRPLGEYGPAQGARGDHGDLDRQPGAEDGLGCQRQDLRRTKAATAGAAGRVDRRPLPDPGVPELPGCGAGVVTGVLTVW